MICTLGAFGFVADTSSSFSFVQGSGLESLSQSGSSESLISAFFSGTGSRVWSYACLSQVTSEQITVNVLPVPVGDSNKPNLYTYEGFKFN